MYETLLTEETLADLLKVADKPTVGRSVPLVSRFRGIKGNVITFATTSGTVPGKFWIQKVQLTGLARALKPYWERPDKVRLLPLFRKAMIGDIRVHCNCPAFKWWGFAYIATVKGYKFGGSQNRYPIVRNPKLKGSVCKHLVNVLRVLLFHAPRFVRQFKAAL